VAPGTQKLDIFNTKIIEKLFVCCKLRLNRIGLLLFESNIFTSVSVCLSVRFHNFESHSLSFTKYSAHVTCGRGSVFLGRHCNALCTSGFVDDALFAHGGHGAARLQRWHRGRASHKFQTYSPVGATVFGGFFHRMK